MTSEKLFDEIYDKIEKALNYTPPISSTKTLENNFVEVTFDPKTQKEYGIIKKYTGKSN